jgi:hypothetical protein
VIVFAILAIAIIVLLTAVAAIYHKLSGCKRWPDYFCRDDWYCPGSSQYPKGTTGFASSRFGPTSPFATVCRFQAGPNDTGVQPASCTCGWAGQTVDYNGEVCAGATGGTGPTGPAVTNTVPTGPAMPMGGTGMMPFNQLVNAQ